MDNKSMNWIRNNKIKQESPSMAIFLIKISPENTNYFSRII